MVSMKQSFMMSNSAVDHARNFVPSPYLAGESLFSIWCECFLKIFVMKFRVWYIVPAQKFDIRQSMCQL